MDDLTAKAEAVMAAVLEHVADALLAHAVLFAGLGTNEETTTVATGSHTASAAAAGLPRRGGMGPWRVMAA
ncbi:hypothetical protein [Streptomyces sp. MMG1121]|uniref:hypothetical protein n=1 Tax=Streptomyces sp. MMG1121 TaxID=1415544 RepID=UPI000D14A32D|nr:hypothetical protein [Streptomyces sp. MMG1121]